MGNTKTYYFEGESKEKFTSQDLLEQSHGTYCALEWDDLGYLGTADRPEPPWFYGALHSYSTTADEFVNWLALRCETLKVMRGDWGWSDFRAMYFEAGKLVAQGHHGPILAPLIDLNIQKIVACPHCQQSLPDALKLCEALESAVNSLGLSEAHLREAETRVAYFRRECDHSEYLKALGLFFREHYTEEVARGEHDRFGNSTHEAVIYYLKREREAAKAGFFDKPAQ